jgi:hypothetical protein
MEAIDKLYETIMENENNSIKKDSKSKKLPMIDVNSSNGKNCCKAAVRYTTIGNAYRSMMNQNTEVWLIDEDNDGNTKTHAFSRCLKTISDENGYCHIHSNTIKNNGQSKVKDFEKDILPTDSSDKTRRLANEDDKYFLPMGKRGAKKKNSVNTYTFQDEFNPILLVLNHKNPKLITPLTICATQLLKTSKENVTMEITKLSNLKNYNLKKEYIDSNKKYTKLTKSTKSTEIKESFKMNKDIITIAVSVIIVLCTAIIGVIVYNVNDRNNMAKNIEAAIAKGVDPISVKCAYETNVNSVCIAYSMAKK